MLRWEAKDGQEEAWSDAALRATRGLPGLRCPSALLAVLPHPTRDSVLSPAPLPAQNLELVERLQGVAQRKGCTASQLALAWVLAQGPDVVPIPGAPWVGRRRGSLLSLLWPWHAARRTAECSRSAGQISTSAADGWMHARWATPVAGPGCQQWRRRHGGGKLSFGSPSAGTRRVKYLEENLGAARVQLSQEDLRELEEAFPHHQVWGPGWQRLPKGRRAELLSAAHLDKWQHAPSRWHGAKSWQERGRGCSGEVTPLKEEQAEGWRVSLPGPIPQPHLAEGAWLEVLGWV